jgi:hypothetical protein
MAGFCWIEGSRDFLSYKPSSRVQFAILAARERIPAAYTQRGRADELWKRRLQRNPWASFEFASSTAIAWKPFDMAPNDFIAASMFSFCISAMFFGMSISRWYPWIGLVILALADHCNGLSSPIIVGMSSDTVG